MMKSVDCKKGENNRAAQPTEGTRHYDAMWFHKQIIVLCATATRIWIISGLLRSIACLF